MCGSLIVDRLREDHVPDPPDAVNVVGLPDVAQVGHHEGYLPPPHTAPHLEVEAMCHEYTLFSWICVRHAATCSIAGLWCGPVACAFAQACITVGTVRSHTYGVRVRVRSQTYGVRVGVGVVVRVGVSTRIELSIPAETILVESVLMSM